MSCWCRTTVLRIPASSLGFRYKKDWEKFLDKKINHSQIGPGGFGESICDDYEHWFPGCHDYCYSKDPEQLLPEPDPRYPDSIPGPFLDYYLEQIEPLEQEERTYHTDDIARELTKEEMEEYLPYYQAVLPDFTLDDMKAVHYCRYEWYNGAEPSYCY